MVFPSTILQALSVSFGVGFPRVFNTGFPPEPSLTNGSTEGQRWWRPLFWESIVRPTNGNKNTMRFGVFRLPSLRAKSYILHNGEIHVDCMRRDVHVYIYILLNYRNAHKLYVDIHDYIQRYTACTSAVHWSTAVSLVIGKQCGTLTCFREQTKKSVQAASITKRERGIPAIEFKNGMVEVWVNPNISNQTRRTNT